MFTANSMNCLTEALGLSLPGNGSVLATHSDRKELFLEAGRTIVRLAKRYYEQDDVSALPRSIASFEAFENAMARGEFERGDKAKFYRYTVVKGEGETYRVARCLPDRS